MCPFPFYLVHVYDSVMTIAARVGDGGQLLLYLFPSEVLLANGVEVDDNRDRVRKLTLRESENDPRERMSGSRTSVRERGGAIGRLPADSADPIGNGLRATSINEMRNLKRSSTCERTTPSAGRPSERAPPHRLMSLILRLSDLPAANLRLVFLYTRTFRHSTKLLCSLFIREAATAADTVSSRQLENSILLSTLVYSSLKKTNPALLYRTQTLPHCIVLCCCTCCCCRRRLLLLLLLLFSG